LGPVKIGQFGLTKERYRPDLPHEFESLDERFFSLGQDADYYEGVVKLGPDIAPALMTALRDVVADLDLYRRAKREDVMGVSLMRSVNERTLTGQFHRILGGGARLTEYEFRYSGPKQIDPESDPIELSFHVEPLTTPPTNIHVLIGRNGVGKSFLLNAMSRALVYPNESESETGRFSDPPNPFTFDDDDNEFSSPFANIVAVTFSAFDDFPVVPRPRNAIKGVQYTNIGLRKVGIVDQKGARKYGTVTRLSEELSQDFIDSAKVCSLGDRRDRWLAALRTLESDPLFEESGVSGLARSSGDGFGVRAGRIFRGLSSGHKIVLLTLTKLVEKVDERTLVLMDEPETHLHPPLLSAFIRALSDLLINRNGVAIIATHSPVVLQEVPRSCVWHIRRHGGTTVAERVQIETFAEHVGRLTHEVFGLEVTESGFHKMIANAVQPEDDLEAVGEKFDHEIGSEGRALISALLVHGDSSDAEGDN
ncbi:MAG: AAA family ATPase, partial [Gammaproteobacteria bacterium]|nr:AAA family ATPase [Gammaproteobacteria bacterium]